MTPKQILLGFLTIVAFVILGFSLIESWNQPQIQSRLELYQTNLVLHASEWQGNVTQTNQTTAQEANPLQSALFGTEPLKNGLEQYQEVRKSAQKNLAKTQTQLAKLPDLPAASSTTAPAPKAGSPSKTALAERKELLQAQSRLEKLIAELDLRIGVLQVQQEQKAAGLQTWNTLTQEFQDQPNQAGVVNTAQILIGLWSDPPALFPNAEPLLKQNLDGWFRYKSLARFYQLTQREEALGNLQSVEQATAQQAVTKLAIVGGIPALGFLLGVGLLIFLTVQRFARGKESFIAKNGEEPWPTPWGGETVWQVFILGFFLTGQILVPWLILPLLLKILGINPATFDEKTRAFSILLSYVLLALGGLGVLYASIKPFLPLPEGWFSFRFGRVSWLLWGLGGYLVALPLVIVVSLLNQLIWQGQGGSNPILPIALEGRDSVALSIFFLTASVAAPLFEEFMFRGFLLPSLTRYLSVWGAIVVSSLLFAVAHLSLSEILPLTVLGMVLGVVYTRSRNLLAPMLLHSLWNSGTLVSLYILGSGAR